MRYSVIAVAIAVMLQCTACTVKTLPPKQQCRYQNELGAGSKLLNFGAIYTDEKTVDGQFIRQFYFYDTKTVTARTQYANQYFTTRHGSYRAWTDEGIPYAEGAYKNGLRDGKWTYYNFKSGKPDRTGHYDGDKEEGPWTTFDSLGRVSSVIKYKGGKAYGYELNFNPDGSIKDSIPVDVDDTTQVQPAFPCDNALDTTAKCGENSLSRFLAKIVHYPPNARDNDISGVVLMSFVVGKDGKVRDVYCINGLCNELKNEGIRVVNAMPAWSPGRVMGKPVKVRYNLPIRFRLE